MSIPEDVLHSIIPSIDKKDDLYNLCLTSVLFWNVTKRYLYRKINVHRMLDLIRLCRTLLLSSSLSRFIHWLKIGPVDACPSYEPYPLAPGAARLVSRAVRYMPNLKVLFLENQQEEYSYLLVNLACYPPQLLQLDITISGITSQIIALLEHQCTVEDLTINSLHMVTPQDAVALWEIPKSSLPRLYRLCAALEVSRSLVAGRPVRHLEVHGEAYEYDKSQIVNAVSDWGLSTATLRHLRVCLRGLAGLEKICHHLPELVDLRVFAGRCGISKACYLLSDEGAALQDLPYLERLDLMAWRGQTWHEDEQEWQSTPFPDDCGPLLVAFRERMPQTLACLRILITCGINARVAHADEIISHKRKLLRGNKPSNVWIEERKKVACEMIDRQGYSSCDDQDHWYTCGND